MDSGGVRPPIWKPVLLFAGDVLVLLLLMAVAMAGWLLLGEVMPTKASLHPVMPFLMVGSLSVVPLFLVWRCWPTLSVTTKKSLPISLAWGVGAGVLALLIYHPMEWLARLVGSEMPVAGNEEAIAQLFATSTLLALIDLVVVAPVAEELLFRKLMLGRFIKSGFPHWGIVLTSLLFAFMHEPFPAQGQALGGWLLLFANYFLMGALLASVYVRTGRLSAAIAAHATNNLVVCLFYLAGQ